MQCQVCKERMATIHLTEINSGERFESHLCESCAQEQGLAVKSQIPLNELLSTLLAAQEQGSTEESVADKTCPQCGMTLEGFQKESLLGCPYDYDVFDKTLQMIIEKSQGGNTTHQGKVPTRVPQDTAAQVELMTLRQQLEAAVKAEDYEKAAKLRDKIEHIDENK